MVARTTTTTLDPVVVATASSPGTRLAWSGVWSGFLVAVGVFLLLGVLGLAIGVSAADVGANRAGNARELGIGAVVWSGASLLIALFVGGMAATRSGMVSDAAAGTIEGVLIWVLAVLSLIALAGSGIAIVSGTLFDALGGVTPRSMAAAAPGALAQAQPEAQAATWTTLAAMVLALLASIAGAMVGRRQVMRRAADIRIHDRT